MTDEECRKYTIKCVDHDLGAAEDNLFRARHAAKGCNPDNQWGHSGQTLNQIIQGYAEWKGQADATLAWLRKGGTQ